MFEAIISGTIQGIAEWLPISSEGLLILIKTNFFGGSLGIALKEVLFLHLGTVLAALVYFRKDVCGLIKTFFNYKSADEENRQVLKFIIITSVISGLLGLLFLKVLTDFEMTAKVINLAIGLLLLITAFFLIKAKKMKGDKKIIQNSDSVLLGFLQGIAVLPGLSRSGLTVSGLLLRKFDDEAALRLSFLMSIPIVLAGNVVLNFDKFSFDGYSFISFLFAFVFGIITIDLLLRFARKINFGYFVLIFGIITILAVLI